MTILFYPDAINSYSRLIYALNELDIDFHNDPLKPYDLFIYWSYHGTVRPHDDFILQSNCINKGCHDITKSRIDSIFDSLNVDPEQYNGLIVRKTEKQNSCDELLMQCPTQKKQGYVYRKFIDIWENGYYNDYRIFYFGGIKFLCRKQFKKMFDKNADFIWTQLDKNIIPVQKQQQIETACKTFGVELCEIDLLKDKQGNWYVIDINNISGCHADWHSDRMKNIRGLYNYNVNQFLKSHVNI